MLEAYTASESLNDAGFGNAPHPPLDQAQRSHYESQGTSEETRIDFRNLNLLPKSVPNRRDSPARGRKLNRGAHPEIGKAMWKQDWSARGRDNTVDVIDSCQSARSRCRVCVKIRPRCIHILPDLKRISRTDNAQLHISEIPILWKEPVDMYLIA